MFWLAILVINWFFAVILYEKITLKKIKPLVRDNEALHSQYPAFTRVHDKTWFTSRLINYATVWVMPVRILTAFACLSALWVGSVVLSLGLPQGNDVEITGIRYFLIRVYFKFWCRIIIFCIAAVWWIDY